MPTFSFPSQTTLTIDEQPVIETENVNTKKMPKSRSTLTGTGTGTGKGRRKVNGSGTDTSEGKEKHATEPEIVEESKTYIVESTTCEENQHNDMNEDESNPTPTFPDIVILKQTDKNYIVKHNHYSLPNQEKVTHDDNSVSTNTITTTSGPVPSLIPSADLVSPNQIYKGQINKKRGRKPKAGFILNSSTGMYDTSEVPNIILHLKCHLSDLKLNDSISNYDYTPSIHEVESYNLSSNILQSSDIGNTYSQDEDDNHESGHVEIINMHKKIQENGNSIYFPETSRERITSTIAPSNTTGTATNIVNTKTLTSGIITPMTTNTGPMGATSILSTQNVTDGVSIIGSKKTASDSAIHVLNERHQKDIMKKINRLKYSFHNGETIQMKLNHKCACFWDTCEFDGPIYYIPTMIVNGVFHVSGCYCSPECALASLLKEQMDTSTKFERIHLLHLLYGNPNNKGFKPAPNPNYLLDKYYGNLTIDEYRSLLKGTQMIHIVNKPLTHILPELYEDNNDFLVNSKVIPTNNLKLKKKYKTTLVQSCGAD